MVIYAAPLGLLIEPFPLFNRDEVKGVVALYRHDLTAEYVRAILAYDPDTGELTWRATKSGRSNGKQVGSIVACHNGHRRVLTIDGKMYRAHRVIWLWMTGEWPENDIDHEDRDATNNRWKNLKDKTKADNNRNRVKKFKPYGTAGRGRVTHSG